MSSPESSSQSDFQERNFESLYRPVEGVAENIRSRTLALLGLGFSTVEAFALPVAPVLDAVDSRINDARQSVEYLQNADHESAHLLLNILNDSPVSRIWSSRYGPNLTMALGLPKGMVATSYNESILTHSALAAGFRDLVNPEILDASKLSDEWVVRHTFMLLSGYAFGIDFERIDRAFALPAVFGSDVSKVKQILTSTKYKNVMKEVFDLLVGKIAKFLEDPLAIKIIDIFSSELLERHDIHAEGKELAPVMLELLEKKGISRADFDGLRKRYDEFVSETVTGMREFLQ